MTPRLLGTIGMLGSSMMLVEWLAAPVPNARTQLVGVVSLVFILCWMSSVVGLYRLGAAGSGAGGRAVLLAQLLGLGLACIWALLHAVSAEPDRSTLLYRVTDAAWPLSVLFMLVVGTATARARVLPGWRRFTPLLCGLALPALVLGGVLAGERGGGFAFAVHTTLAWTLLGHSVRGAASAGRVSAARAA
jgi:hypothetical protein